jgi:LysM repeat protein
MNRICSSRTLIIVLLVGILMFGLTSCKLPASKGPQSNSNGFPVPGGSNQTPGGIDVSTFATQTAQAVPPIVAPSSVPSENPTTSPNPEATSVPGVPEPTSAPITYVTATPGGPPTSYTLEVGEFPFCIARRFNVNLAELLSLNGLTANSFFYAGQVLQIPQTGNPFEGTRALHDHPTTYKIQSGDTLNIIACYFGDVSPDMIYRQNDLHSTDLPVGEVLIIP